MAKTTRSVTGITELKQRLKSCQQTIRNQTQRIRELTAERDQMLKERDALLNAINPVSPDDINLHSPSLHPTSHPTKKVEL